MKVQAAVHFEKSNELVIQELDLEDPRPDEVLIKTVACGVCHTDIWVQQNYTNAMVLGHEASGVIERIGSNIETLKSGDHVVTAYNWCGECEACREGRTWECDSFNDSFDGLRPDGTTPLSLSGKPVTPLMREGGFAAKMVCHKNSVIKVDSSLDLRLLGPLGCGIMTGAGSVLNYLNPEPGRPIAVFGTGCVGLSAIMAARIAGCDPIIAVDRLPSRLELAVKLGATHCANGENADIAKFIKSICGGVDYAFDTSGSSHLLDAMRKILNPGASACGVGIGGRLALNERERREGKSWTTTDTGFSVPPLFIPKLLEYHKAGRFPFEKMLHFYQFDEINEAFEANRACTVVKPVVLMEGRAYL
ncbi:MAG: NAD(P)-dependent alcohol dehydrogenase [Synergistaceae bacterium]|jgi:aryl-alcohol dehydrogenase|nr:NAD(P)-dependent alcohol dehydrogenase [Synergistaceae bacterium]